MADKHKEHGSCDEINMQFFGDGLLFSWILKKLLIVEISPWNKGFLISLFVPETINEKSFLFIIAAPNILFPKLTFFVVIGIIFFSKIFKTLFINFIFIKMGGYPPIDISKELIFRKDCV